jgi:hypothetical protein
MPSALLYLREEVRLSGAPWESFGAKWQALASLWLRAEATLVKSGHSTLSYNEIDQSSIPEEWKDWMSSKLLRTNVK